MTDEEAKRLVLTRWPRSGVKRNTKGEYQIVRELFTGRWLAVTGWWPEEGKAWRMAAVRAQQLTGGIRPREESAYA